MPEPLRIAMWSGPRNISTAMMRSFENRGDCAVSDEPLYGAWLAATGERHPMAAEVIAAMETDWRAVAATLTGPVPESAALWYQKHMTHHLLPEMMRSDWLSRLTHVFLIRDPRRVVASYLRKRETVSPEAIGVPQQQALFDFTRNGLGQDPPVIDADDFLADPESQLRALCDRLSIAFTDAMLAWPPGPRASDGVWAPHWYQTVWQSTGFSPPATDRPTLAGQAAAVAETCLPVYRRFREHRLRA
ncbi:MAG: hypothetical protein V2J10_03390 [Wenzhouxiangella sp.]|nr:hypothetical protein [Wenzhouxiangella sp.]